MARRRRMLMQMPGEPNYFNSKIFWSQGERIGGGFEYFIQYEFQVPYGNYVVSTNVIDNTNANIASVMARYKATSGTPSSGGNGVFNGRPRTLINTNTVCICIRTESGSYLTWNEETFSPYYVKIEAQ